MKKIGFVGVGIMGKSMVRNLMKAGFEVSIYTRTKSKVEDVIGEGAIWCDSVAECAKGRDAVISIVGYPKDVIEVYFGPAGILANADPGTYVIDMTTTSPKLAVQIFDEAEKLGLHAIDAPVTGGDSGAKAGTLTILAGGKKEDFDTCMPVFEAMGKNINYEGKAGNGQHTKMCNQIAIAGALAGACEAMVYAKNVGLDVDVMLKSISTGAAGSAQMNNVASKALKDDFNPGFFLKHFIKDMSLAEEEAAASEENKDLARPKLFIFNIILTIAVIALLIKDIFPSYVPFMIGVAVAILVNYPGAKMQKKIINMHSGPALMMCSTLMGAAVLMGILVKDIEGVTSVITCMSNLISSILPAALGQHLPLVIGILSVPLALAFDTDSYFYGMLPVMIGIGEGFGVSAMPIAVAMVVCRNCATFISPMVPATLLGVGLADVDIKDHIKNSFLWVWGFSIVCMLIAIVLGIMPL